MVKGLILTCMLLTSEVLKADWLKDMALSYAESGSFNRHKALSIIEGYIKKDEDKRNDLQKDAQKNDKAGGILPGIRKVSDKTEIALVNRKLDYHKKVACVIKEFAHNKKQEKSFADSLKKLATYIKQRETLQKELKKKEDSNALETFEVAEYKAKIAVKETQIKGYKTYIENILIY